MTDQQEAACIRKEFAKHVATIERPRPGCEILRWKAPSTTDFLVRYVCVDGTLYVSGDVGSAVYHAYGYEDRGWDLRGYAGCQLDYFASKCQASEYGLPCKEWHEATALEYLRDYRLQRDRDRDEEDSDGDDPEWLDAYLEAMRHVEGEHDWREFLRVRGEDLLGSDWWECGSIGMRVGMRIRYHLIGLQMALAQLDATGSPPPAPDPRDWGPHHEHAWDANGYCPCCDKRRAEVNEGSPCQCSTREDCPLHRPGARPEVLAIVRRNSERYHEAMVEWAKGPGPAETAIVAAIEADGEAYDMAMAQLASRADGRSIKPLGLAKLDAQADDADPNHVCTLYGCCCSGCGQEWTTP